MNRQLVVVVLIVVVVVAVVAGAVVGVGAFLTLSRTATGEASGPNVPVVVVTVERPAVGVETADDPAAEVSEEDAPAQAVSFEAATYRDEEAGFEFDYPAAWVPDEQVFGERGAGVQFNPSEGAWLTVMVTLWDPKNDLDAFVAQRQTGWSASGATVLAEETWTLADQREVASFVVEGVDGEPAYFMFTTLGERYLQVSGSGDLDLLAEIARTVRPLTEG